MGKANKKSVKGKSPVTKKPKKAVKTKLVADKLAMRLTKQNKRNIIRRNKTAWIYFCTEKRPDVVNALPGKSFGEICKHLASMWHELPAEDRKRYVLLAEEDKKRYMNSSNDLTDIQKKFLKRYKRAKREQRKSHPKTALSPYMYYVIDKRNEVVGTLPGNTKFEDIGRLLGENWKNLEEKDRLPYMHKSNQDKIRYQREIEHYRQSRSKPQASAEC